MNHSRRLLFRTNTKAPAKEHVNFFMNLGGLGDLIARLPAIKYCETNIPNVIPHVWVPDYAIPLCKNLLPKSIIKPFSKGEKECNNNLPGRKAEHPSINTLQSHL